MRLLLPSVTFAQERAAVAEAERVIVTGSNIPTAEEVGPNPVDTYRPTDIEKLGVRNATDFLTNLPQEMGSTINQNMVNGGDGSVIPNLRGLLPKETLVLIDGKRVAITKEEWSERDKRHRRQSCEGSSERVRAMSEFQKDLRDRTKAFA